MKPVKPIRIKENMNSIQLYEEGEYIGSISKTDLCQFVKLKKRIGTTEVLAHVKLLNDSIE